MGMIEGPGNNTGEGAVLMSYHNGNSSVSLQKQKRVLFFINQCKLPGGHCKGPSAQDKYTAVCRENCSPFYLYRILFANFFYLLWEEASLIVGPHKKLLVA